MEIPLNIADSMTVFAIDGEAGIVVLEDAAGNLHVCEFKGTISSRPLTSREKAYATQLAGGTAVSETA